MSKGKKLPLVRLSDLSPGQFADFFAQLAEKTRGSTRDGKPFYTCRFRDARRPVSAPVWADSPHFEDCQANWQPLPQRPQASLGPRPLRPLAATGWVVSTDQDDASVYPG